MAEMPNMAIWALVAIAAIFAGYSMGLFGTPAAGSLVGGGVQGGTLVLQSVSAGGCPQAGTTDIQSKATQSIADPSTGVKTQVHGAIAYYYAGTVSPFETTTLSNTAYASSTTDPPCGTSGIFLIFTNASYYHLKYQVPTLPLAPSIQVAVEPDLISAVTLWGYNETNGGAQTATSINVALEASSTSSDAKIQLKLTTARGTVHQPILCWGGFDHTLAASANMSSVYFANSVGKSIGTGDCGSNMSGMSECYLLDVNGDGKWDAKDILKDQASFYVTPVMTTAAASIHPEMNITFTFADIGTYTAAKDEVLFEGCANAATKADVGATNAVYKITLNQ